MSLNSYTFCRPSPEGTGIIANSKVLLKLPEAETENDVNYFHAQEMKENKLKEVNLTLWDEIRNGSFGNQLFDMQLLEVKLLSSSKHCLMLN